ncbi:lysophospholipid acyltransferase family protein [Roseobacter sp. HKCCA0434]|uniref:lysophospholipid acyltransferase family protein n=1 Tax=Roseobacter sp. HKCCA0434 TaxID=3079297 RepID=UPI002905F00B|nr:DUF374 domain-containing protein [Roseobacter sp. HKCCA0434]
MARPLRRWWKRRGYALGGRLAYYYLRFVWATARVEFTGDADIRALARSGDARFVLALWHGRVAGATRIVKDGVPIIGIASRSGDGAFAAAFLEPMGVELIRGSSANPRKPRKDKGGAAAMAAALGVFRKRAAGIVTLTPDGPTGPRGRCKHGVAVIAARAGVPVVPLSFSARRAWQLDSWDRALIPLPFTRVSVMWGSPVAPPAETGDPEAVERFRLSIETALNDLTTRNDVEAGRPDPWAPAAEAA